jgi:hypothetical protein
MVEYAASKDFIMLRSFDGEEFHVPSVLARRSRVVAASMDTGEHAATGAVPVPVGVTGRVLAAVIAYWIGRNAVGTGDLGRYDDEYVIGLRHDVRATWANGGSSSSLGHRSLQTSRSKLATVLRSSCRPKTSVHW